MFKGLILMVIVSSLVAIVCIYFGRKAVDDTIEFYEDVIRQKLVEKDEIRRERDKLSRRCAELEAKLSTTRYNEPQKEFYPVPTSKVEFRKAIN